LALKCDPVFLGDAGADALCGVRGDGDLAAIRPVQGAPVIVAKSKQRQPPVARRCGGAAERPFSEHTTGFLFGAGRAWLSQITEEAWMKSAMFLIAAAAVALAMPAMAQDACARPAAPTVTADAASATMEQLVATKTEVGKFMTDSDAYQSCVIASVTAQRADAKKNKVKFDNAIAKAADKDIAANQADKERVGKAFNAALKSYKAAHPS
jgi:hypothetical protein